MRCWTKGGNVFLITSNTEQALLLVATRILRPRLSRGVGASQPRNIIGAWPWQRPVREPGLALHRTHPRAVRVHEQSAIAFCPRPQTRHGIVLGHERVAASTIREQAVAAAGPQPSSVHDVGRFTSATAPLARTALASRLAMAYPRQRIRVSVEPPTQFSVHIHFLPAYGRV